MTQPSMLQNLYKDNKQRLLLSIFPDDIIGDKPTNSSAVVISSPVITGDDIVMVDTDVVVEFSAVPGLSFTTIREFTLTHTRGSSTTVLTIPAVANKASYTFHPTVQELDVVMSLDVQAIDTYNNLSAHTIKHITPKQNGVCAPTLLAPIDGEINALSSVTFITAAFKDLTKTETHVASQYQILSSDRTVVFDSLETTSALTSYVATALTLHSNTRYICRCRHKGSVTGWSQWSSDANIVAITKSLHGSRLEDKATVIGPITYNAGTFYIAVLDAAHRPPVGSGTYNPTSAKVGYLPYPGSATFPAVQMVPIGADDSWETIVARGNDPMTSEYNTTQHLKYLSTVNANCLTRTRGVTLNSTACCIPNITCVLAISKYRVFLDECDPTVAAYPDRKLNNTDTLLIGSSASHMANGINTKWYSVMYNDGKVSHGNQDFMVCPILEIPA